MVSSWVRTVTLPALVTAWIGGVGPGPGPTPAQGQTGVASEWVFESQAGDGRLIYRPDALGNRIPDFSHAGYGGGLAAIPDVAAKVTVAPGMGDDTAAIQAAIDQVSALPMGPDGFRGAVQLTAGTFEVGGSLRIDTSGVVLRGAGSGLNQTILYGTGTGQRTLLTVAGSGSRQEVSGSRRDIVDKYVPVGATSFRVAGAGNFQVGDRIVVHRPSTAEWIHDIGMDQIPPRNDGGPVTQWEPGKFDQFYDRTITRIEGDRVFIDAPLVNAIEQKYGGGTLYKYTFNNRIQNVGVENIRGMSQHTHATDEDHAWQFIDINAAEDVWVRDVVGQYFGFGTVNVGRTGRAITVEDAANLDPIAETAGSRKYPFYIGGSQTLMQRLYSDGARHAFAVNARSEGPNAFLDAVAENSITDSGPHHRWATGTLYDNVTESSQINVRNRGNLGTGHGWAGANFVIWNSQADSMNIQSPPTARNWAIGAIVRTRSGNGTWEHVGQRVDPESLYRAQIRDRQRYPDLSVRTYLLGDYDGLEYDGPSSFDHVHVADAWQLAVAAAVTGPVSAFDTDPTASGGASQGAVPFSFEFRLDGEERPVAAMLIAGLRLADDGTGAPPAPADLALHLDEVGNAFSFDQLGWEALSHDETSVVMLDLGDELWRTWDGSLDGLFTGPVAVDWVMLELHVTAVPEPAAAALLLLPLALATRRRRHT